MRQKFSSTTTTHFAVVVVVRVAVFSSEAFRNAFRAREEQ
jgi:hypothetical protein